MLFSEPKIPQLGAAGLRTLRTPAKFQCSSASRKFLNSVRPVINLQVSESFSALQRAENSSTKRIEDAGRGLEKFQCSSASRKFLNITQTIAPRPKHASFSALQRAENSSTERTGGADCCAHGKFQCSSASRKFLNQRAVARVRRYAGVSVLFSEPKIPQRVAGNGRVRFCECFSALQRAENSSTALHRWGAGRTSRVSVLFSEPKIPQLDEHADSTLNVLVSVLFSEPKIPQHRPRPRLGRVSRVGFSALQRAENSSTYPNHRAPAQARQFQCSSASRKFLNDDPSSSRGIDRTRFQCSSASRKFLNPAARRRNHACRRAFQCSSASRKFLNCLGRGAILWVITGFQCSSASRKFLNLPMPR